MCVRRPGVPYDTVSRLTPWFLLQRQNCRLADRMHLKEKPRVQPLKLFMGSGLQYSMYDPLLKQHARGM